MAIRGSCGHVLDRDKLQGVFWMEGTDVIFGYLCEECKDYTQAIVSESPVAARLALTVTCKVEVTREKKNEAKPDRKRNHYHL